MLTIGAPLEEKMPSPALPSEVRPVYELMLMRSCENSEPKTSAWLKGPVSKFAVSSGWSTRTAAVSKRLCALSCVKPDRKVGVET